MPDTDEYEEATKQLHDFGERLVTLIKDMLVHEGIRVDAINYRVKNRTSALSKIRENPDKYSSIKDLTDLLGLRIITYFPDQVDLIGELIDREFNVDAQRSTDKRALLDPDRFGYASLHKLACLNQSRSTLSEYAQYQATYVEIQIRSVLQHAWAEIEHDLGYKSEGSVPVEIRRRFSRLAGLLELADAEFRAIRDERNSYTRRVSSQIRIGLGDLLLDSISLQAYVGHSTTVSRLDRDIALIFRGHLDANERVSPYYLDRILNALLPLGIGTIQELDNKLVSNAELALKFAKQWANKAKREGDVPEEFPRGVSLYYLAMVLAASDFRELPDSLEGWVVTLLDLPPSVAQEIQVSYEKAVEKV